MELERLAVYLPYVATVMVLALSLVTAGHAVLYKRDPRAAVSWTGFILLVPVGGAIFYVLFGINRIQRKAMGLRRRRKRLDRAASARVCTQEELCRDLSSEYEHLAPVASVAEAITGRPLLEGNRVTPLVNGEEAYPA